MIGTTLAHYDVVEEIGEGGMGAVYRARDTRLGRDVALKVLPAEFANDPDRIERFRREARALAAIDHPNIVTVYSVEDDGGVHFLTMALVTGENLEAKLLQGPLPLPDFLDVASQLTDALAAAHDNNVIHRDLKPGNVMVSGEGRVKVLDFGLAKLAEADPSESVTKLETQTGTVLGTVPYMSPEQVQGQPLDQRSDIFSLGVLLHEMATGQRPFRGENPASLTTSILRDEPPDVTDINPSMPGALGEIVSGCLKKELDQRFQTSGDVHHELAKLRSGDFAAGPKDVAAGQPAAVGRGAGATPAAGPAPHTPPPASPVAKAVVVLPFVNRSPDPDNEYFSDGLTEEVISDLSGIGALRVISRNSAMTLKGTEKDSRTLAAELGVSHLVTGSVRRAGDALRVTAELVEAPTDALIWSDKYSGSVEDVFGIQEEISRKIVSALEVKLTEAESQQVGARPVEDPAAYDCYLRARYELYGWTPESQEKAHRVVDEALEIVGDNAVLLATKSHIHYMALEVMLGPPDESFAAAERYMERALEVDPEAPLGIFMRGMLASGRGDVEQTLADLYRAQQAWPGDGNVLVQLGRKSNASGLQGHGPWIERLKAVDPLWNIAGFVESTYHSVNGRHAEAASIIRDVIVRTPGASPVHTCGAWQIAEAGHTDEALEILGRAADTAAGTLIGSWALVLKAALEGDADAALEHGTPELHDRVRADHFVRTLADAYALAGLRDEAISWLRRAIGAGFTNYPCWTEHNPFVASLHDDPEFQEIMAELKPRWEALVEWERGLG